MLRLLLLVLFLTNANTIQLGLIRNASLMASSYARVMINITTCNECVCAMLLSNISFSLNCFSNNNSCQLFSDDPSSDQIEINLNSTFYFRHIEKISSHTTAITVTTTPVIVTSKPVTRRSVTEMKHDFAVTTSGAPENADCFPTWISSVNSKNDLWIFVGNMSTPRVGHTSTYLQQDNSVLIVGGSGSTSGTTLETTEKYIASTGCFISTNSIEPPRESHTADEVPLAESLILLAGGTYAGYILSTAELFNLRSTVFMTAARSLHTSSIVSSKVILIGGVDSNGTALNSGDVFDGSMFTSVTNTMSVGRVSHTATTLPTQNLVLITGGSNDNSIDIYDESSNSFLPLVNITMSSARQGHTATYIPSPFDKVLIVGGGPFYDLFDPSTFSFPIFGRQMRNNRKMHTATLLSNGSVLLVGGLSSTSTTLSSVLSLCELFDPITNSFSPAASLNIARSSHTATLIENKILVCGGRDSNFLPLDTCELYIP